MQDIINSPISSNGKLYRSCGNSNNTTTSAVSSIETLSVISPFLLCLSFLLPDQVLKHLPVGEASFIKPP